MYLSICQIHVSVCAMSYNVDDVAVAVAAAASAAASVSVLSISLQFVSVH